MGRQTWRKQTDYALAGGLRNNRRSGEELGDKPVELLLPDKLQCLFRPAPFKVLYGSRGGAKSWGVAISYLLKARAERDALFLCARELQNSISDSVYSLLESQASRLGIHGEFVFQKKEIWHKQSNSKFIFKGIRRSPEDIKSTEGVKYCWVEEAAKLTEQSINILFPTIRMDDSEITLTYNPDLDSDPVHRMFVVDEPPPGSVVVKIGWQDNPWFPDSLNRQRLYMLKKDKDLYDWIWNGNTRKASEYAIYAKMVSQEPFESPNETALVDGRRVRFYYGGDWGFGSDPCAGVRMFVVGKILYVDYEAYEFDLDVDDVPGFFEGNLPGIKKYTSFFDNQRPELIRRLKKAGFDARPCSKGSGSIEAGIAFIKSFDKIVVHPRCPHVFEEFMGYKYKTKKKTLEDEQVEYVEPEDKNNHCMDSVRYGFDREINNIGDVAVSDEFLQAYAAMGSTRRR